jgi:uncharacterized membrane protein YoaK (UPF0700 family)
LPETEYYAGSLLFAMGMQKAMVSMISGSVVRTTQLTGMLTEVGMDLSAALVSREPLPAAFKCQNRIAALHHFFFFIWRPAGRDHIFAVSFTAFYIPVGLLLTALFYDYFRIKLTKVIRHRQHK